MSETPTPTPTSTPEPEPEPEAPATRIEVDAPSPDSTKTARLVVPDDSTADSAFGGDLRTYDIHIAKMFEVTHWWCMESPGDKNGLSWQYLAGSGDIDMGTFNISCDVAMSIGGRFGFSTPEETTIRINNGVPINEEIPLLDIDSNASSGWIDFASIYAPGEDFRFNPDPAPRPVTSPASPGTTRQGTPWRDSGAAGQGQPLREPVVGSCDCPYDSKRNGHSCGRGSAYYRDGELAPRCFTDDP